MYSGLQICMDGSKFIYYYVPLNALFMLTHYPLTSPVRVAALRAATTFFYATFFYFVISFDWNVQFL